MGEKEFAKGDVVMFLRNNKELEVKNGERGIIFDVDKNNQTITVHMHDGSVREVNLKEYNYINYGYAMTVHKSQGQTVDRIIYLSDSKQATSNKFYVAITRGKEECHILTKDVNELLEKLQQEQKPDIAGWNYGRDEDGKLQTSENDVKDYRAIEDVKQTIFDSANRETWYSLTPEQKEALVEGNLDSQTLQEKAEQVVEKTGNWYPEGEKLEAREVTKELEKEFGESFKTEKEGQGLSKEKPDLNFNPEVELDEKEEKFNPEVKLEREEYRQEQQEQREKQSEEKEELEAQQEEQKSQQEEQPQMKEQMEEQIEMELEH